MSNLYVLCFVGWEEECETYSRLLTSKRKVIMDIKGNVKCIQCC